MTQQQNARPSLGDGRGARPADEAGAGYDDVCRLEVRDQ